MTPKMPSGADHLLPLAGLSILARRDPLAIPVNSVSKPTESLNKFATNC